MIKVNNLIPFLSEYILKEIENLSSVVKETLAQCSLGELEKAVETPTAPLVLSICNSMERGYTFSIS